MENAKAGTGGFLVLIHAIFTMILSVPKAFSGSSRGYWRKWEMLRQGEQVDLGYFNFHISLGNQDGKNHKKAQSCRL